MLQITCPTSCTHALQLFLKPPSKLEEQPHSQSLCRIESHDYCWHTLHHTLGPRDNLASGRMIRPYLSFCLRPKADLLILLLRGPTQEAQGPGGHPREPADFHWHSAPATLGLHPKHIPPCSADQVRVNFTTSRSFVWPFWPARSSPACNYGTTRYHTVVNVSSLLKADLSQGVAPFHSVSQKKAIAQTCVLQ